MGAALLAEVALRQRSGDAEGALALLDADGGDDALLLVATVDVALQLGRLDRALDAARRVIARAPDDDAARAAFGAAVVAAARAAGPQALPEGQLERATALLRRAAERQSFSAPARSAIATNLGLAEQLRGNAEAALAAYDRAIAIDANNCNARYNRAAVLFAATRFADALTALEEILQRDSAHVGALRSRVSTLLKLNRRDDARRAFDAARPLLPSDELTALQALL